MIIPEITDGFIRQFRHYLAARLYPGNSKQYYLFGHLNGPRHQSLDLAQSWC